MTTVRFDGDMAFVGQGKSGLEARMDAGVGSGGHASGPTPVELLLFAVGGCSGMDVVSILRKMKSEPEALVIEIVDERAQEHPKRITALHLTFVARGNMPEDALKKAIDLSLSKYCTVANTLRPGVEISWGYRIEPA